MASKSTAKKGGIAATALAMILGVVAVEGGYVNHPNDPGGETNKGVTKAVAVQHGYTGPMRTIPDAVVHSIYYDSYLVAPGYEPLIEIDPAVTEELFDTTVNMGPGRPGRWFQQSVNAACGSGLAVDGKVGPATVAAFRSCQGTIAPAELCSTLLDLLDAAQRAEYHRLVRANAKLKVFYRGWINKRIGNVDRASCNTARA